MTTPDGGTPPAAPAIVPPAPNQPATPPAAPTVDDQNPPWLAERLSRAESQLLKRLGVKDETEVKALIEARRKTEEDSKSLEQKRVEAEKRAKELEEALGERDEIVKRVADSRMASLSEAQKKAILDRAGDDPILQLELLDLAQAFAGTQAPAASAQPAAAKPAQTAAPAAPPPAPGTPKTDFEKWNDMKQRDPLGASLFYQLNSMKIEQSRT